MDIEPKKLTALLDFFYEVHNFITNNHNDDGKKFNYGDYIYVNNYIIIYARDDYYYLYEITLYNVHIIIEQEKKYYISSSYNWDFCKIIHAKTTNIIFDNYINKHIVKNITKRFNLYRILIFIIANKRKTNISIKYFLPQELIDYIYQII